MARIVVDEQLREYNQNLNSWMVWRSTPQDTTAAKVLSDASAGSLIEKCHETRPKNI
jgi:hypothetical protein